MNEPPVLIMMPENFTLLHRGEEQVREKSLQHIQGDRCLILHMAVTERAMNLLDVFRRQPTDSEDGRAVRALGLRVFNAFASATKLVLSGYMQTSALVLRDVLEVVFLLDLFQHDPSSIARWRMKETRKEQEEFRPATVRRVLDARDGFTTGKRADLYKQFCELAAHPTLQGFAMIKGPDGNVRGGPFFEAGGLGAVLAEMGRLGVQFGGFVIEAMALEDEEAIHARNGFIEIKAEWFREFYGVG